MEFTGFRDDAFAFFKELATNNSEEWFDANQDRFEEFVRSPMRSLVTSLRDDLRKLHPALVQDDIDAHFSEMRRGAHSRPGSAPIKTSFYCFFWDSSVRRLNDGWFFVGVGADGVTIGMSIYDFGDPECRMRRIFKPRLRRYLTYLDDYIKANYLRRGFDFHRYVRAAGKLGIREVEAFPSAAAEWDATLGWVVKRHLHTESSRLTPGSFLTEVKESFERLYPLYSFTSDPREEFLRLLRVPMRARAANPNAPVPPTGRTTTATSAAVPSVATPETGTKVPAEGKPKKKARGALAGAGEPAAETTTSTAKAAKSPATKSAAPAKPATEKPAAKKSASKKLAADKPAAKRTTKKAAAKKSTSKKAAAKKAAPKKATAKKAAAKQPTNKKRSAKPAAKKSAAKQVAKKKTTAKKAATKRPAKKKAVAKRATHKKKATAKKKSATKPAARPTAKRSAPAARASARAR